MSLATTDSKASRVGEAAGAGVIDTELVECERVNYRDMTIRQTTYSCRGSWTLASTVDSVANATPTTTAPKNRAKSFLMILWILRYRA